MQTTQNGGLPKGWVNVKLADISSIEMGQSPESSSYNSIGEGLPFFQGKAEFRSVFPEIRKWCTAPTKVVEASDILLSIRAPVGPTNIAPQKSCIGRGLAGIRGEAGVNQHYLYYFFKHIEPWLSGQGTGSTFAAISGQFVREISCPVAPTAEQTRIVEKLEELLADLDAGVAELKAAQKKLAQYRQSLLKAAVEGDLTADWRRQHTPTETGAELLSRILKERRARWEAKQREKFASQGKTPPKNWQSKYPEPVAPDTQNLPKLPEGWEWASLDQLVAESSYGTSVKCSYERNGTPTLRIPNVSQGQLVLQDMKYSTVELNLHKDEYLSIGDVLVIRTNGSIGLVGRAAAVVSELPSPHYFASYLLRLRCVEVTCVHRWILTALTAHSGRQWLEKRAASSAGQHNISLSTLLTMPIPLPPISEQFHALREIEEGEYSIQQQQEALKQSLKQSTAQRQNILRTAFAGELVPQDPNDEPASALLERIRAQRAAQTPAKKPRKSRKPQETSKP
ncbi:restriction endonuclease [Vandammella animalimorsus]|uniref:Restriction endonuclease n=2 Tax=Vandammella animalimorsus TaxID=2029117 RepID=A0A2A2AGQ6_9BURK|nr:restriction endonuclease [Vandammella animalimorsus]